MIDRVSSLQKASRLYICFILQMSLIVHLFVRPDIFYFSSFKNPDRIFTRNGKKIKFKNQIFLLPTV